MGCFWTAAPACSTWEKASRVGGTGDTKTTQGLPGEEGIDRVICVSKLTAS